MRIGVKPPPAGVSDTVPLADFAAFAVLVAVTVTFCAALTGFGAVYVAVFPFTTSVPT